MGPPRTLLALAVALLSPPAWGDYMDHFVVREDVGLHKVPSMGPSRLLVIPVEVAGHPALDLGAIQTFFSDEAPDGFVRYYQTASLGRYQPQVTVSPVVQFAACPLPEETFPGCFVARGDIAAFSAGLDMIRLIFKRLAESGFDFSGLDVNGRRGEADGYADGVMLLANFKVWGIAVPFAYYNRGDNLAGGTGGPLVVGGLKVSHVGISGYSDHRVLVHEFGHLLGLTDLYDESGRYDGLHFSLMGAWRDDAKVPLPDAETRYRLRWANLQQFAKAGRVVIPPVESSGEVWRLGTGEEYFLVENRGPGGAFDGEFTSRGLVVFHVDRRVKLRGEEGRFQERLLDCVNCDPWRPYVRVVQADGRFELQEGGRPDYAEDLFGDGASLSPDPSGEPVSPSHPVQSTNWYSGESSGLGLKDVKVRSDGSIEVSFSGPAADPCAEPLCADGPGCQPVSCKPTGGCQSVPGAFPGLALALAALAHRRSKSRNRYRFLKSDSAASSSASCACRTPALPSPIWKNSQKFASSLSDGTSAKGSLHPLATAGSK